MWNSKKNETRKIKQVDLRVIRENETKHGSEWNEDEIEGGDRLTVRSIPGWSELQKMSWSTTTKFPETVSPS